LREAGRIVAFVLTVALVGVAVGGVITFLARSSDAAESGGLLDLPEDSAPSKAILGFYLEARSDALAKPAGGDDSLVAFVIEPGETVPHIASRLEREGLISDSDLFRRYLQYHDLDSGIEAGEFVLRQTMTIPEVAQALQEGHSPEQSVTIREGLRLEEIADAVASQTSISAEEFLLVVTTNWRQLGLGYRFLSEIPDGATLEGFLWPETYLLPEDASAGDLLTRMLDTFDARVTPELRDAARSHGLNTYELVTLASIVEREAVLDEERPLISSVYHNRLNAGWQLGACPTVQYSLGRTGDWWPSLSVDDLALESEYSTYVHVGLPPGPICSPGLESVKAAANPAQTDYFFFLADCESNDGGHLFAVTEAEHLANYNRCGGGLP